MGQFISYGLLILGVAFAAFIWWRYTSVRRGARKRDEKILLLLDPISERLSRKEVVTESEIRDLAGQRHVRVLLFQMLSYFGATDLFPEELLDAGAQAEALLAYWMMHPNELQEPPEQLEREAVVRRVIHGHEAQFYVLRFRMRSGHWAGSDWLLGVAGPFFDAVAPFAGPAGAFSRLVDKAGVVTADDLVDWYVGMMLRKGA